jgi:hypothetical protein
MPPCPILRHLSCCLNFFPCHLHTPSRSRQGHQLQAAPRSPREQTEEVVIDENNRLVIDHQTVGVSTESVSLIDQASPCRPRRNAARAGEECQPRRSHLLQDGIMALAGGQGGTMSATTRRLLVNPRSGPKWGSGRDLYSSLSAAITRRTSPSAASRGGPAQTPRHLGSHGVAIRCFGNVAFRRHTGAR